MGIGSRQENRAIRNLRYRQAWELCGYQEGWSRKAIHYLQISNSRLFFSISFEVVLVYRSICLIFSSNHIMLFMIKIDSNKNTVTKVIMLQMLSNPDNQRISCVTFLVTFCNFFEHPRKTFLGKSYNVTKRLCCKQLNISLFANS